MQGREFNIKPHTTYEQLRRYADTLDLTVCTTPHLPNNRCGCYDEQTHTILIDRSLNYTQKRCTLVHELIHWEHADDACNPAWRTSCEIRTRRKTATALISPNEYQMLEGIYDSDPWQISRELDVTKAVLTDYQSLLREQRIQRNLDSDIGLYADAWH